ncbi:hypothetical protein BD309DRAFT_1081621 [Dichomitus squalens]|nr:hypothetical protein BD309DRAFT_1081621 [Dichomitus squalens]
MSLWLGFTLAPSPAPSFASVGAFVTVAKVSPPWLFFLNEVWPVLPRTDKRHRWYYSKFPDYPKERKVVNPFLF